MTENKENGYRGPMVNGSPGSLIVGIGKNYPKTAHHRASFCCGEDSKVKSNVDVNIWGIYEKKGVG